jgi:hypothetical protein
MGEEETSNQKVALIQLHNQILKQQKQLNGKNHHLPINVNMNVNGINSSIKKHHLANCT